VYYSFSCIVAGVSWGNAAAFKVYDRLFMLMKKDVNDILCLTAVKIA
jgi:hypothetical protein